MNIRKRPTIIACLLITAMLLSTINISTVKAASQLSINNAVTKGLAYLNSTQTLSGEWSPSYSPVAVTAEAVLAFEQAPNNHFGWNLTDPYHTTVQKGLDWLFTQAAVQSLTNKTYTLSGRTVDPCIGTKTCNGIYFSDGSYVTIYETPMVLEAIVASQKQNLTATAGEAVLGQTYHDIVVGIVDYLTWAQDIGPGGEGGWRYFAQYPGSSDNSVSQWPVLGLMAAQLWGINAPDFVKTEMFTYWTNTTQNFDGTPATNTYYGAFGYTDKHVLNSLAETGAGILQLTYAGYPKTDYRVNAAEGYMVREWYSSASWVSNFGDFYDMYAVMKAARLATDKVNGVSFGSPIKYLLNYTGFPTIEWYNGTGQYADYLVANQFSNGHWTTTAGPEYIPDDLTTAWGVLILEFVPIVTLRHLTVNVYDNATGAPISGAEVLANGPLTALNTTTSNGATQFTFKAAGVYTVNASATGYFPSALYTVDLRLRDNTTSIRLQPTTKPLLVGKFFTDSILNPLPADRFGNPSVNVVLARSIVRSTNPGQVIAWVNVTNTSGSSIQSLKLNDTLPVDWLVHPAWIPAKGAIHVYYANTQSLATNLEITNPQTITVSTTNPETVQVAIPSFNATLIGHPLMPGQSILLAVKLSYGLTMTIQSPSSYPRNYTDTAAAQGWSQISYKGMEATGAGSASFIAYANVADTELVTFGNLTVRIDLRTGTWIE